MGIQKSGIINNARNNRSLPSSWVLNKSSVYITTLIGDNVVNSTVLLNPDADCFIPISQNLATYPIFMSNVSSPSDMIRHYGSTLTLNHANDTFIDINHKQCSSSYSLLIPSTSYCTYYELNPCADMFVPHKSKINVNCKIIAFIAISFILSIFIIYTIYINSKHYSTDNSPKDILRQLKLGNPHKI